MVRRAHVVVALCLAIPLCASGRVPPPPRQQSRSGLPAEPTQPQQPPATTPKPTPPTPAPTPSATPPPIPQTTTQQGQQGRITARTDMVIVPVTVKDKNGQLVGDLQREDFHVLQDNVEQSIVYFSSDPFPLSAVVLIDDNLAQRQEAQVRKSLTAISAGFAADDEVAVMTYDSYPQVVSNFSKQNDQIYAVLKNLALGSHDATIYSGPTNEGTVINGQQVPNGQGPAAHGAGRPSNDIALDDAVYAASEMLKGRGRDRRKIIFLISDGTNSRHNTHTYEEALHSLLAADVNVYAISTSRTIPLGPFGHSPLQRNSGSPQKYASDTGGDSFYAGKDRELEALYSSISEEARNQYTLSFAAHPADMSRDYHSIEVRVSQPGLDVIAKQGYYLSAIRAGR